MGFRIWCTQFPVFTVITNDFLQAMTDPMYPVNFSRTTDHGRGQDTLIVWPVKNNIMFSSDNRWLILNLFCFSLLQEKFITLKIYVQIAQLSFNPEGTTFR